MAFQLGNASTRKHEKKPIQKDTLRNTAGTSHWVKECSGNSEFQEWDRTEKQRTSRNKKAELNSSISLITLNVNGLKNQLKQKDWH